MNAEKNEMCLAIANDVIRWNLRFYMKEEEKRIKFNQY